MVIGSTIGLIGGATGFCLVAILVATGPVIYMTHHSFKHGHVASTPDLALVPAPTNPEDHGWSVCAECDAVVVDAGRHSVAAHQLATT